MGKSELTISWAPRVSRERILELYIKVATGNNDVKLVDEVASAFYNRCSDIIRIFERRFVCPKCREELPYPHSSHNDLYCSKCGWQMPWRDFYRTYRGKQLCVNADVTTITRQFLNDLPECKTSQEKMILIDALIHACHEWVSRGTSYYGRPLAVNFIDGNMNQVVAFLENLPYGPASLPEMNEQLIEWRKQCLSLFSDLEVEMDRITHIVDSMPLDLRAEIEEMLTRSQRQKAVTRLAQIDSYAEELTILSGNLAKQMVRKIEKRMKNL